MFTLIFWVVVITAAAIFEVFTLTMGAQTIGLPWQVARSVASLPLLTIIMALLAWSIGGYWRIVRDVAKWLGLATFLVFGAIVANDALVRHNADEAARATNAASDAEARAGAARDLAAARQRRDSITETAKRADLEAQLADMLATAAKESGKERGGCGRRCQAAEAAASALRQRITDATAREDAEGQMRAAQTRLDVIRPAVAVVAADIAFPGFTVTREQLDGAILLAILVALTIVGSLPLAFGRVLDGLTVAHAHRRRARGLPVSAPLCEIIDVEPEPIPEPVAPPVALPAPDPIRLFAEAALAVCPEGQKGLAIGELRDACLAWCRAEGHEAPVATNGRFSSPLAAAMGLDSITVLPGRGRKTNLTLRDSHAHLMPVTKRVTKSAPGNTR